MEVLWRKVDLHIHSNASYDCELSVEALVDEVVKCGINLFSVTDHNCIDNVSKIQEVVRRKKDQGIELEYLPGLEIRTDKGGHAIHVLAIFPESVTEKILQDKFLPELKLTQTDIIDKGKEDSPKGTSDGKAYIEGLKKKYANFEHVVAATKALGGLVIAAHPKSSSGIEKELDYGNTQNELICDLVKKVDIIEVRRNKANEDKDFYLNKKKNFIRELASIKNSDAHFIGSNPYDVSDDRIIGRNYSWIKMDTINFQGLTQILYEPELRTCVNDNIPVINHQYIREISVTGGYYKDTSIVFSPELNTIIGGRGSGKSVVIDLIRFVLGKYSPDDFNYLDRLYQLVRTTNTVTMTFFDEQGKLKTISRILDLAKQNEKAYSDFSISVDPILDVEIFSQGELKNISRKADQKIRLIDEIGDSEALHKKLKSIVRELEQNANCQIQSLSDISSDMEIVAQKASIIALIETSQSLLKEPLLQEFQLYAEDKKYLDLVVKNLRNIASLKEQYLSQCSSYQEIDFPDTTRQLLNVLQTESSRIFASIAIHDKEDLEMLNSYIDQIIHLSINDELWIELYNRKEAEYTNYLKANGMENLIDETQRLKKLKDQVAEIENNIEPRLNRYIEQISELQSARCKLLDEYNRLSAALYQTRKEAAYRLSQEIDGIEITLSQQKSYSPLKEFLVEVFSGKNVQKKQIDNIINLGLSGFELAKFIKENDLAGLMGKSDISTHTASSLIGELSGAHSLNKFELSPISALLFRLELIQPVDDIDIKILDRDENKFKDFSRFSPGEQCSYLLNILLKSSNKPLIIDQPEDELDWAYIIDFVTKLRELKCNCGSNSRQVILVTHNQNITVLADSEMVIKVKHLSLEDDDGATRGTLEATGGLERSDVKNSIMSLEGGAPAFELRGKKYGYKFEGQIKFP